MNQLESFEKLALLGLTLSVKTKQGDQFTGELFFYNPDARIVILKEKIFESEKYNYRYLNVDYLTEFKILSIRDINQVDFELPDIDFEEILKREADPDGTSAQPENKQNYGEYLFQKLSNQHKYKVTWEKKDLKIEPINVKLRAPYRPDDILCVDPKTVKEFTKLLEDLKKSYR